MRIMVNATEDGKLSVVKLPEGLGTCKTCKHWVPFPSAAQYENQCDLMRLDGGPDNPMASSVSCSCCSSETGVGTKPDFGCNQWEPK